jgi:hypothetical protein
LPRGQGGTKQGLLAPKWKRCKNAAKRKISLDQKAASSASLPLLPLPLAPPLPPLPPPPLLPPG